MLIIEEILKYLSFEGNKIFTKIYLLIWNLSNNGQATQSKSDGRLNNSRPSLIITLKIIYQTRGIRHTFDYIHSQPDSVGYIHIYDVFCINLMIGINIIINW